MLIVIQMNLKNVLIGIKYILITIQIITYVVNLLVLLEMIQVIIIYTIQTQFMEQE